MRLSGSAAAVAHSVLPIAQKCRVVVIDGPSGSGKSTLAATLVASWPGSAPNLVALDSAYAGWSGLGQGIVQVRRGVALPIRVGRAGSYKVWDWQASEYRGLQRISPKHPIVVEGCGAIDVAIGLRLPNRSLGGILRIWMEASLDTRKSRALKRDGIRFASHWDDWETQWRKYIARTSPAQRADVAVRLR